MGAGRRLAALAHAMTRRFERKAESARAVVREAMSKGPAYVALSGGKDSTAVLALVREANPDVPAVWADDVFFLPETAEYMAGVPGLRRIQTNARHCDWFTTLGEWDGIPDYARSQDWYVTFLGLRMGENARRRQHLRHRGPLFFCQEDDFWHANPIWDWSALDVWAFIHTWGVEYNRAYDRLEQIGVPLERQRIGPYACERALGQGQLAILRRGWPDEFRRFCDAHPEARHHG